LKGLSGEFTVSAGGFGGQGSFPTTQTLFGNLFPNTTANLAVNFPSPPIRNPKAKKKDALMPKRPKTAYVFFCTMEREKFVAENPGIKFGDLSKLMGQEWKRMTSEQKGKYDAQATNDKERYRKEMDLYNTKKN